MRKKTPWYKNIIYQKSLIFKIIDKEELHYIVK